MPQLAPRDPAPTAPSPPARAPKGRVTQHTLPPGSLYPGATHDYWVYTPATPTRGRLPVTIFLDGSELHLAEKPLESTQAATVLDNLIASGEIPPMAGVFVDPGVTPASREDQEPRYERSFEYDSLSDRYSQFLFGELLPAVMREHRLSSRPDDCCIVGVSTSAVAALVAAWHRPDRVRRVVGFIGTFLAMRGAESLASLIRKSEPRPLRVWLQANARDHIDDLQPWGTFWGGSWATASRSVHDSLQYAGYDCDLVWGDGGHDLAHGATVFPDALRWIWRDWHPSRELTVRKPAVVGTAAWKPEGSVWSIIEEPADWLRFPVEGRPTALASDPAGRLIIATADGAVVDSGRPAAPLAESLPPGSAIAAHAGEILVGTTDGDIVSVWSGRQSRVAALGIPIRALLHSGDGVIHALAGDSVATLSKAAPVRWTPVAGALAPSSLAISPDLSQLVIGDEASRDQWSMMRDRRGVPGMAEPYFRLETVDAHVGATSAISDSTGRIYFGTRLGIQVCDPIGRTAAILAPPVPGGRITGMTFAGARFDRLWVLCEGQLFHRRLRAHAVPVTHPERPPKPAL